MLKGKPSKKSQIISLSRCRSDTNSNTQTGMHGKLISQKKKSLSFSSYFQSFPETLCSLLNSALLPPALLKKTWVTLKPYWLVWHIFLHQVLARQRQATLNCNAPKLVFSSGNRKRIERFVKQFIVSLNKACVFLFVCDLGSCSCTCTFF